ncbi:MAG: asparagine synthase-related protein, partial [Planctomycetota bacterium]
QPLLWMSYLDLKLRLPELLLMRVDKMAMGVSLEARVPFLDHKLVELALSIPAAMKSAGGELKHILKRAVRGVIPDRIIERPKQGFGVPVREWLLEGLGERAREEVEAFNRATGLLHPPAVEALFERRPAQELWLLLNVAMWWRRFLG